ncbi:MAG: hypothetical protein ACRD2H_15015 [Terriglobales bacterium]
MNGFLAVWIPQFPLQALHWAEPRRALARAPQAVLEDLGPVREVVAADSLARRQGITGGLTEAQARLQAANLIAHERSHWLEQRLQVWLSEQLDGFSDRCQWLPPDRWLLHLAGLERLLGDEEAIARKLRRQLRAARLRPALGAAATRGAALLAAQAAASSCWMIPPSETSSALGSLPLDVLRGLAGCSPAEASAAAQILERWGLKTLGELAALPRRGLAERLGKAGLDLQRWARGEDAGLLVPDLKPEPPVEFKQAFEPPLEGYFQLLPWLEQECRNECRVLEKMDRALGAIEVELLLAAGERTEAVEARAGAMTTLAPKNWRWSQIFQVPHRDAKRLCRQLETVLAVQPPPAAIAAGRLRFSVVKPQRVQPRLFGEAEVESERTERLLARLRELLQDPDGKRVGSARLRDLHRHDSFVMIPFQPASAPGPPARRPRGLGLCLQAFRPPPPIAMRFPDTPSLAGAPRLDEAICRLPGSPAVRVLHASGPWRTSGEWWKDGSWSGDEWDVELENRRLYRLLYDRKARAWFLAGEYD